MKNEKVQGQEKVREFELSVKFEILEKVRNFITTCRILNVDNYCSIK